MKVAEWHNCDIAATSQCDTDATFIWMSHCDAFATLMRYRIATYIWKSHSCRNATDRRHRNATQMPFLYECRKCVAMRYSYKNRVCVALRCRRYVALRHECDFHIKAVTTKARRILWIITQAYVVLWQRVLGFVDPAVSLQMKWNWCLITAGW